MNEINVYTCTQKRNVKHMMYSCNVFTRIYKCKPDMSLPLRRQAGGSHRCSWKNYKVLQRTTPVLLCSTKYCASTTLYYKVLRQYYSVVQSTTPVLLSTTQCYANTTLYYPVLQRPSPLLLYTTKYYASTSLYYKVLKRTSPLLLCTTKDYANTIF